MFERRGRLSVIGYALAMFTGRLPQLNSYRIVSADRVHIGGGGGEPVQGDGDILTNLDVTIEVVPEGLWLVFPPAAATAASVDARRYTPVTPGSDSDRIAAYTPRR